MSGFALALTSGHFREGKLPTTARRGGRVHSPVLARTTLLLLGVLMITPLSTRGEPTESNESLERTWEPLYSCPCLDREGLAAFSGFLFAVMCYRTFD